MSHENTLDVNRAALIVIDIQEAFRDAIPAFEQIATRVCTTIQGFQLLGVPVIVTEQYPRGLGHTAAEIRLVLSDENAPLEKSTFSSCGAAGFVQKLDGVSQVVVCGIEAHICVNQTVHDLLDLGFQVHVLHDCVSSRFDDDRRAALAKMGRSGAIESSTEMALFELMQDSKHESFREVQALIR